MNIHVNILNLSNHVNQPVANNLVLKETKISKLYKCFIVTGIIGAIIITILLLFFIFYVINNPNQFSSGTEKIFMVIALCACVLYCIAFVSLVIYFFTKNQFNYVNVAIAINLIIQALFHYYIIKLDFTIIMTILLLQLSFILGMYYGLSEFGNEDEIKKINEMKQVNKMNDNEQKLENIK